MILHGWVVMMILVCDHGSQEDYQKHFSYDLAEGSLA
jgi:hypothetical protein